MKKCVGVLCHSYTCLLALVVELLPCYSTSDMGQDVYYAVARSPMLEGSAIFKQWSSAYPFCIDESTGRPYPGARFKKFETVEEAKAFIENSSSGSNTNVYRATTHKTINKTARRHSPDTNASSLRVLSSPSFPHKPRRRNIKKIACEDDVCCPRTVSSDTDNEMDVMENAVHIYTDGACLGNGTASAKAGYGVFFGDSDSRNTCGRLDEREHVPTNQRAELMAILQALKIVRKDRRVVVIHSDSKYSMQCFDSWLPKWRVNGFQTSKNTSVKNLDLIMKIDALIQERGLSKFRFEYVPGHQGDHGNEAADRLARQGVHAEVV